MVTDHHAAHEGGSGTGPRRARRGNTDDRATAHKHPAAHHRHRRCCRPRFCILTACFEPACWTAAFGTERQPWLPVFPAQQADSSTSDGTAVFFFFFCHVTVLRSLTTCLGFGRLHVLGPAADRRFVRSSGRRPVLGPPAGPRGPAERQPTCLFFGPVRRPAVPGRSGRRSCCFFFGSSPAAAHGRSCSLVSRSCFLVLLPSLAFRI